MGIGPTGKIRAAFRSAAFFNRRMFEYKRALWFAWSLMTWEQRMAFRAKLPDMARVLSAADLVAGRRLHPDGMSCVTKTAYRYDANGHRRWCLDCGEPL